MNPKHSSRAAVVAGVTSILLAAACSTASTTAQSNPTPTSEPPLPADAGSSESAEASPVEEASTSDDAGEPDSSPPVAYDASLEAVDAAPVTIDVSDAGTASVDIISPARCDDRSGHFLDCVIPPTTIEAGTAPDAGAFQTVLTVVRSGDCSSQYPLVLILNAVGASQTLFHLEDGSATVRRNDSAAIDTLVITDGSSWTGAAVYGDSCRTSIDVQMNVVATN